MMMKLVIVPLLQGFRFKAELKGKESLPGGKERKQLAIGYLKLAIRNSKLET